MPLIGFFIEKMKKVFLCLCCLFVLFSVLKPGLALASTVEVGTGGTLEAYLCKVLQYLTGKVGKAIAAFACIGVSLGFVAGKLAWATVLTFAIGMACIFGAPQIVKSFAGGDEACKNVEIDSIRESDTDVN
jgi:type IV secretory pathway VirB2 component (pilin)